LDARAASHPQHGGFKTYVENLLPGLAVVEQQAAFRVYLDRPWPPAACLGARFEVRPVGPGWPWIGAAWREQVGLPWRAHRDRLDLLHCPAGTGPLWSAQPLVVTMHDAIPQLPVPGRWGGAKRSVRRQAMELYYRLVQRQLARRATLVLTPSEHARQDLERYLGLDGQKLRVVPEAAAAVFRPLGEGPGLGLTGDGRQRFILALGSADPRKNLPALVRAYARLPSALMASYRLVVVWSHKRWRAHLAGLAAKLGVGERVTALAAPTSADLCRLYNRAAAFVFPSLYEGFGLPPLEAMACGTPVIAAATSSLPEVLDDGALLVPPTANALSQALIRVLEDAPLREALAARGLARAGCFSWERTARLTLAAYDEALSSLAGRRG
jgi:glycosyltransferase involved in cell wall biosynthesis